MIDLRMHPSIKKTQNSKLNLILLHVIPEPASRCQLCTAVVLHGASRTLKAPAVPI